MWPSVRFIAGKESSIQTCEPEAAQPFTILGAGDLPLVIDALPGPVYGYWVGWEVRWLLDGTEVSHRVGRQSTDAP